MSKYKKAAIEIIGLFGGIILFLTIQNTKFKNLTFNLKAASATNNIETPFFYPQPVVSFGNSSYHDSLGIRDPYVVKEDGRYYLFFDCIETFLNPSFEPKMGTNGWSSWHASIIPSREKFLFGTQSLKMITEPIFGAGAYTADYFYGGINDQDHLAVPGGIDVIPGETYFASVYFWASPGTRLGLMVQQYRDDPKFYSQNVIPEATVVDEKEGNNDWQRLIVKFIVHNDARVITLSFVNRSNGETLSFWDGVQVELAREKISPDPFPQQFDFDQDLEDVVGWRSCYAVSDDGINFSKKGLVRIIGPKQPWEIYEKPGWVGTSGMYLNPFKFEGKWYSYTWTAGYRIDPGDSLLVDKGGSSRRLGYGDRRAFLPNGTMVRSGLVMAEKVEGPYQRISPTMPAILPENYPQSCQTEVRDNERATIVWGCEYLAASGSPVFYQNKWILFLSGGTYRIKDTWAGTLDPLYPAHFGIGSGIAMSDSPFGPWKTNFTSRLFSPEDIGRVHKSLEGPIYYFDKGSGTHIVFVNLISGGARAIEAYWSRNLVFGWTVDQGKEVINRCHKPGNSPNKCFEGAINLATVTEDEANRLNLYYGYREKEETGARSYLFHNIGLAQFNLPLFSSPPEETKDSQVLSINYLNSNLIRIRTKYINRLGLNNLALLQLIISHSANWQVKPYYLRAMYVRKRTEVFDRGVYLYDPDFKNERYGWGNPGGINEWVTNNFGQVRILETKEENDSVEIFWELVVNREKMPPGKYHLYLWQADENSQQQNNLTQPMEIVVLNNKEWYFTKAEELEIDDIRFFLLNYGTENSLADLNSDGRINGLDFRIRIRK